MPSRPPIDALRGSLDLLDNANDISGVIPVGPKPTAVASAATLASDECGTALSIEHFSSRHSLGEECFWRTMQSQQSDSISGARGPVLESVIEDQAVWTD